MLSQSRYGEGRQGIIWIFGIRNLERMNPLRGILSWDGLKQPCVLSSKECLDEFTYDRLGRKTVQKCNNTHRVG